MRYLFFAFLLVLLPGASLSAQTDLLYSQQALSIDLAPLFPGPEESFTATINDYSLPRQGSGIRWFVDGNLVPEAKNERSLSLTAKKAGSATKIEVVVDFADGKSVRNAVTVNPVWLDVIIEPQTRVPAFYSGRALPSSGSTVNATALINGGATTPGNLMYTWRVNNQVLNGGSVRGKNNVSFTMPQGQYATLNLEVRSVSGETIARRIFDIQSAKPDISFYEVSTLYGMNERAITGTLPLIGSSLTVRAEPYHLALETFNRPDHVEWKIAGVRYPNSSNNPYEVTLATQGGSGRSSINFHVRNTVQVLQGAQNSFTVSY